MNINLAMIEPTDDGVLEDLARKRVHHREEALMLAVLKSATEDFQKYVCARDRKGKLLFNEAKEWLLEKDSDSLLVSKVSVRVYGFNPIIYVKDCSGGKRRIVSRVDQANEF